MQLITTALYLLNGKMGMDREFGATEACAFVKKIDFPTSEIAFDAAFEKKKKR